MADKTEKYFYGLGRRKEATARVRLYARKGESLVNDKTASEYFGNEKLSGEIYEPLTLLGVVEKYVIVAKVNGGGKTSQAEAIRLGVARALVVIDEANKTTLRKVGFLTRDSRVKERMKPGLKKARKAPQFSKR